MTYEVFKETLMAELTNHFPPDTQITIHTLPRNNHVFLEGLTILEAGYNASPAIYLQEFYERMSDGHTFLQVYQEILAAYQHLRPRCLVDTSFFEDFNRQKKRIVCKLVHFERNRQLLSQIPHIPYLDLAIVFYSLLSVDSAGATTILIRNSHLQRWNISPQQLYRLALANAPALLSPRIDNLAELLSRRMPREILHDVEIDPALIRYPLYLLTNQNSLQGAACILYPNVLADFAAQKGCDLYIIPSSVHEVLLLPVSCSMDRKSLNEMVLEVNSTQLSPEEILSDHVYYYQREENKITL